MNTLFSPYSATPAGRRRRQHIRAQVRHARTRRRSSTLSRVLDGARRKAGRRRAGRWRAARRRRERRSDATKSLFTQSFQAPHPLSLANWKKSHLELDQVYCAWLIKWWIISGTWWYWVSIWRYLLVLGQLKLVSSIKQKLSHAMTYDGNFSNQSLVLSPCQSRGLGDPRSYNVPRSFLEIQHTVATASQGHWQPMR